MSFIYNMIIDYNYLPILEDFTKEKTLKLSAILKILLNSGNKHSDLADDNILAGSNNGVAWILSDWFIEVLDYPKYGSEIIAKTWTEPVTQIFCCMRDFELYADGKLAAHGLTKWVLLDLNTGRPKKIEKELIDKYGPEEKMTFETSKLAKLLEPQSFLQETSLKVRRTDIDFNGHVHNLTYLDYALESLPQEKYDSKQNFKKLRISFKADLKQGDEINCCYAECENSSVIQIFTGDKKLATQIELS
ncbi:MAG: hypothetical protein K6A89_11465 [Treponema sp.]|nr:hypothetical protein [Treponema sp.]